jgi:hypothetical protein
MENGSVVWTLPNACATIRLTKTHDNKSLERRVFEFGMSENEAAMNNGAGEPTAPEASTEEITYHAVEKDGVVTAIWEMQGRKHLRTIDPRSRQGQDILRLYTTEHHDEVAGEAAAS